MNKRYYVFFFVLAFLIFWATSNGDTPYNYFTRLADAFVEGKLFITDAPSWLSHLVGAFIVLATVKIAEKFSKRVDVAVWSAILAGVGTIMWYEAATGSVWYLGQITAAV